MQSWELYPLCTLSSLRVCQSKLHLIYISCHMFQISQESRDALRFCRVLCNWSLNFRCELHVQVKCCTQSSLCSLHFGLYWWKYTCCNSDSTSACIHSKLDAVFASVSPVFAGLPVARIVFFAQDDFADNKEFITVLVYKNEGRRVFYPCA